MLRTSARQAGLFILCGILAAHCSGNPPPPIPAIPQRAVPVVPLAPQAQASGEILVDGQPWGISGASSIRDLSAPRPARVSITLEDGSQLQLEFTAFGPGTYLAGSSNTLAVSFTPAGQQKTFRTPSSQMAKTPIAFWMRLQGPLGQVMSGDFGGVVQSASSPDSKPTYHVLRGRLAFATPECPGEVGPEPSTEESGSDQRTRRISPTTR